MILESLVEWKREELGRLTLIFHHLVVEHHLIQRMRETKWIQCSSAKILTSLTLLIINLDSRHSNNSNLLISNNNNHKLHFLIRLRTYLLRLILEVCFWHLKTHLCLLTLYLMTHSISNLINYLYLRCTLLMLLALLLSLNLL